MGIRVFAVDDHDVALSGLRDQLQLAGFQLVGTASTGKDAIEQLKTLQVDVILIDVRMDDMDGLVILESVRERHPVILGLSNKEIAQSLTISVETVKEHVQNILRKIKAKDRTDAAVRAIRSGMFEI